MQRDTHQSSLIRLNLMLNYDFEDYEYENDDNIVLFSLITTVKNALELDKNIMNFYTHEIIDVCHNSEFFDAAMLNVVSEDFSFLHKIDVVIAFNFLDDHNDFHFASTVNDFYSSVLSSIFVFDIDEEINEVSLIINAFSLNVEQRRAFDLIIYHSLNHFDLSN